jgi:hypothetical protein
MVNPLPSHASHALANMPAFTPSPLHAGQIALRPAVWETQPLPSHELHLRFSACDTWPDPPHAEYDGRRTNRFFFMAHANVGNQAKMRELF